MRPDVVAMLCRSFPEHVEADARAVLASLPDSPYPPTGSIGLVLVCGEAVAIPHRFYSPEPGRMRTDGSLSSKVLACIYTRHNDGIVRQRHLERLLSAREDWVAPFVVQLLGEYVIEILDVMAARLGELQREPYTRFVAENREFMRLTRERMISYWDCYYRLRYPLLSDYVGTKVLAALTK
jgi:hypothetical protein